MDLTAHVPQDLADLLPTFMDNRLQEVDDLKGALAKTDLERVRHLGERMYAVGNPYGFRQITTLGRQLRDACDAQNAEAMLDVIDLYEKYLANVHVTIVDAPVLRPEWSPAKRAAAARPERVPATNLLRSSRDERGRAQSAKK